jgi:hypothetical protein
MYLQGHASAIFLFLKKMKELKSEEPIMTTSKAMPVLFSFF